ncbi:Hypothetical protein, putative [Bodo saltans]|uniref:Uncharacterized protein n=1 Tax=Bodo saltans TaxID=75058 RepID=A0A0S4JB44_BODSA|nr:Hypothetical protein, putative [Bodo saltans]|eukprot:CUG87429.1 Hypothetical protein, putative [Bodo saltans]
MLMIALLSTVKSFTDLVGLAIAFPVAMKKAHARVSSTYTPPVKEELWDIVQLGENDEEDLSMLPDSVVVVEVPEENHDAPLDIDDADEAFDQFMNDAAFAFVEMGVTGDESILNGRDAPDDHQAAPFDFIRDAATLSKSHHGDDDAGALLSELDLDFIHDLARDDDDSLVAITTDYRGDDDSSTIFAPEAAEDLEAVEEAVMSGEGVDLVVKE